MQRRGVGRLGFDWLGPAAWGCVSLALHALVLVRGCAPPERPDTPTRFELPAEVDFGLASGTPGGAQAGQAPIAAEAEPDNAPPPEQPPVRKARSEPRPSAFSATPTPRQPSAAAAQRPVPAQQPAAQSGEGAGAAQSSAGRGSGLGDGMGPGSGFAPAGATLALNVDLRRVRKTALVLETESLLGIVPEWQALLAGSGIDAMDDLDRVFVASPTLERASVVVAADHRLGRERVASAVAQLAREQGSPAPFRTQHGYAVAAWRNRGPTARSIALTRDGQFTITRTSDLERVLQVASSLAELRQEQGFAQAELDRHGGLLAMDNNEAVALWVENVAKYTRGQSAGMPRSLRLSLFPVDQFHTDLRVRGDYASASSASEALAIMDELRRSLSAHPRVTFLGLKSAIDAAQIEQHGSALGLQVRLTLHQTRYLMRYVTRALRPRASP